MKERGPVAMNDEQNGDANSEPRDDHADDAIDWHSGFYDAVRAELAPYLKRLSIEREHYLTTQPLRMDALIIKKDSDLTIEKSFAEHFRGHNIVEFKSPEDSLSVADFLKALGYACLYPSVESARYTDVTLTVICSRFPYALFKELRDITPASKYRKPKARYFCAGQGSGSAACSM
jgi:hypothetical protein